MVFEPSLAIDNLPLAASNLSGGRLYVVVHDEGAPVLAVAWPTLLAASQAGPAQWITERDPERELASATPQANEMRRALGTGRLKSFQWSGVATYGFHRLLQELDYFGAAKAGLVVMDGADRFFEGADPGAADAIIAACRWWAEQNACALLLLCARRIGRADPAETLRPAAHRLGGFARFRRVDNGLWWDVFHWHGAEATVAGRSFCLATQADGRMAVEEDKAPRTTFEPAVDEDAVFMTRAALPGKLPPPAAWHVAEDFDALGAAVANATAATIILHYDQTTPLDALARAVFGLRQSHGARIKIVVREVNVRMRYNQEQLIMRLGTNLVVPAEVIFSRFVSMVGMVQGQLFTHSLEADYETAVAGVVSTSARGYLVPSVFIETVTAVMKQARVLDIQNALIRLPLAPGLSPSDALRYASMRRPGDLCTADEDSVYVFLFACRESDIGLTLDRLFRLPVPELFEGEVRYLSPETIRQAVEDLTVRAQNGQLAVLTPALAAAGPGQPMLPGETVPSAGLEPVAQRRAPFRAVRRPLSLRAAPPIVASS